MAALQIDTTVAGENSNSYVTVQDCSDYWNSHYNLTAAATWSGLTASQQTSLLVQACRVLETARFVNPATRRDYVLRYSRSTREVLSLPVLLEPIRYFWWQRLQFPRNLDIAKTAFGTDNPGDVYIPDPVKWAQCEQAMYTLTFDNSILANHLQGVTLEKVSIGANQLDTTQEYSGNGSAYSPVAFQLLSPYMLRGARVRRA